MKIIDPESTQEAEDMARVSLRYHLENADGSPSVWTVERSICSPRPALVTRDYVVRRTDAGNVVCERS